MRKATAVLSALLLTGALTACGDDDESASSGGRDLERYCEIVVELENSDDPAVEGAETPEDFAAAFGQFVEDHEDEIDGLVESAPDEIADDVEFQIDALRGGIEDGDLDTRLSTEEFTAAEQRVTAFEAENCEGADAGEE